MTTAAMEHIDRIQGPHYRCAFTVNATPEEVYSALTTGYRHWWTAPDKPIRKVGDVSKFSFADHGFWTFSATVLKPGHVEMACVDAKHRYEEMPQASGTEWIGTTLVWKFSTPGSKTAITFEHIGLHTGLHCYSVCKAGWDLFLMESLRAYLDTGMGKPFKEKKNDSKKPDV